MREKTGSGFRPPRQVEKFQEAFENCGLTDIPTYGYKFTWSNDKRGLGFTKEKLDRVIANRESLNILSGSACNVLLIAIFDHFPHLITL